MSVCCATLYNLICFDGNCKDSEVSNAAWSSLDDVVAEAGKMSVKNNNQYKIPFHSLSTTSETGSVVSPFDALQILLIAVKFVIM